VCVSKATAKIAKQTIILVGVGTRNHLLNFSVVDLLA